MSESDNEPDLEIEMRELRSTRELMHEFNSIVDLLESNDVDKIVVTKSGKPRMVLISTDTAIRYQELDKAAEREADEAIHQEHSARDGRTWEERYGPDHEDE